MRPEQLRDALWLLLQDGEVNVLHKLVEGLRATCRAAKAEAALAGALCEARARALQLPLSTVIENGALQEIHHTLCHLTIWVRTMGTQTWAFNYNGLPDLLWECMQGNVMETVILNRHWPG